MITDNKLLQLLSLFVDEIETFHYSLNGLDLVWDVLFPTSNERWHFLRIVKYQGTYYFCDMTGDADNFGYRAPDEISSPNSHTFPVLDQWPELITAAQRWLKEVRKNWIAANKRVQLEYPLELREGTVPLSLVEASLPDFFRLDEAFGLERTKRMVEIIEEGYFMKSTHAKVESFSANRFFEYCKIAYIAAQDTDEHVNPALSGRDLYRMFADGRDDGLLQLEGDSEDEFAAWIDHEHPARSTGGHPWEIKRGGNTTHINLAVFRPPYSMNGYIIQLDGESFIRMVETLKMFLAIYDEGLPITIANHESIRTRLLAQDNIGIIPSYVWYHRANQRFRKDQKVFEVLHYKELGRYKRRITPFITWNPLPILRPMENSMGVD